MFEPPHDPSRRTFLRMLAAGTCALAAAGWTSSAHAVEIGPLTGNRRRSKAQQVRTLSAARWRRERAVDHPVNGDETAIPRFLAQFAKSLPHNNLGEPDPAGYTQLRDAIASGKASDFEALPLSVVKLVSPQSAYAYQLEGNDPHAFKIRAAPAFSSEEEAAEMVELYWLALTRDVPFSQYANHPLTLRAAEELSTISTYTGVREDGRITPRTLFRGGWAGELEGPFISQFLLQDMPFGAGTMKQIYRTGAPGFDYMFSYDNWLNIQRGLPSIEFQEKAPENVYLRNHRDLGAYVHVDFSIQAPLTACLILLDMFRGFTINDVGQAGYDPANPYVQYRNQLPFVTLGGPFVLGLVGRAGDAALKAAWYQKWLLHRRLRPEAFAGRIHNHVTGAASYPIHPAVLDSQALAETFNKYGSYLLPMAYREGSPCHPAYPSGHATFAGAGVTMLKAFFNEDLEIVSPVQPSDDGARLEPFSGTLTVGGELNKLASNIALGRDAAGVHWRSDGVEGNILGEQVALSMLKDIRSTLHEDFPGFSLTTFDGRKITI